MTLSSSTIRAWSTRKQRKALLTSLDRTKHSHPRINHLSHMHSRTNLYLITSIRCPSSQVASLTAAVDNRCIITTIKSRTALRRFCPKTTMTSSTLLTWLMIWQASIRHKMRNPETWQVPKVEIASTSANIDRLKIMAQTSRALKVDSMEQRIRLRNLASLTLSLCPMLRHLMRAWPIASRRFLRFNHIRRQTQLNRCPKSTKTLWIRESS